MLGARRYASVTDEHIDKHNVDGLKRVCQGAYSTASKADEQRACETVARWEAEEGAGLKTQPCDAFDPRPGEDTEGEAIGRRLKLNESQPSVVIEKLRARSAFS